MKTIKKIALSSLGFIFLYACEHNTTITPNRGKVKFETISLSSKIAGRIESIYVEEGQKVQKGDTLAIIDVPEVAAKMMQAEGAITIAQGMLTMAYTGATQAQLDQLNGQIDAAKAQLNFAKESYSRLAAMYQDSLISLQQLDEVKMNMNMAQAQLSALEAKYLEVSNSARIEQIDQAKGQLNRAEGVKEEVLNASNEQYIIAPTDMTIETISLQEGELLSPGYALFNGYKTGSVYFRFTIPESQIYNYQVGQELVLSNPYTEDEFEAKIIAIKQLAQYANISSTAPLYTLDEAIYELKIIPLTDVASFPFYLNASILMKD